MVSRTRWYGFSNGMPFQFSTITFDDVPMPNANRPGAAWTMLATVSARVAAPRVYAGTIAVPRRSLGAHAAASVEWRERVGAARLGRPQVGVAEGLRLLEPLLVLVQWDALERDGDAVALLHAASVS